jgi:hypothetical protein
VVAENVKLVKLVESATNRSSGEGCDDVREDTNGCDSLGGLFISPQRVLDEAWV